ncbi:POK18 protein, partial [Baryphthengus martii]|nr:POK18 protein [Baryphthengus martii]
WKYLGWEISQSTVKPQKIVCRPVIQSLNDVQKLVGDLNWVRTICGITNEDLAPIVKLLKGDSDISS